MTTSRMIELAVAAVVLAASVWLYRRPKGPDGYGSQGAVILLVVGAIMAIHALGLMEYRPTQAEADYYQSRSR